MTDITLPSFLRDQMARPRLRPVDPKHAVMAEAFAKIRDARPAPESVADIDRLRAQIALLSDADCIATFVTELIRRGMLDDMRLAIMDARAERMRG